MAKQRLAGLASYQRSTIHEIDEEDFIDFHTQSVTGSVPSVTTTASHSPYSTNNSSVDTDYFSSARQLDRIAEHDDRFYDAQSDSFTDTLPSIPAPSNRPRITSTGEQDLERRASDPDHQQQALLGERVIIPANHNNKCNDLRASPHLAESGSMLCKQNFSLSMDQQYLLDNNNCRSIGDRRSSGSYINGGIQMNILGSSDDTLNIAQTPTATDSSSAATTISNNLSADHWMPIQQYNDTCAAPIVSNNNLTVADATSLADDCITSNPVRAVPSSSAASGSSPNHSCITNTAAASSNLSSSSAAAVTGINTNDRKSPASFQAAVTNKSATNSPSYYRAASFYSGSSPNQSFSSSSSAPAGRSRQRFANNRSVSTDVPSRQRKSPVEPGLLTRPGSHSGPLERINSFDRATQTAQKHRRNSLVRLNLDHKQHPRYESAISDIGVEYMKATGVIGIRFKQLQKPSSQDKDSIAGSTHLLNYDHSDQKNSKSTHVVSSAQSSGRADKQTDGPMTCGGTTKQDHVVKLNSGNEEAPDPHNHHHIGYRLRQRKHLAERRCKLADLCCV